MAAPANTEEFLDLVRKSGVVEDKRLDPWLQKTRAAGLPAKASEAAGLLVRDGILTTFQAEQILQGKWRRFTIGKYKVLEKLGSGGMGSVYLCEHKLMRRRVAVKVLPTAKAADESSLQRFYREARAVAALDHPHIVHAYDIDNDDNLHFLVMEYVDGASFQELVKKVGPLEITRACHYIRAAALGLEHASQAGLIHRDIKPGNILVDRTGVVKILDMGLARFFNDEDDVLTKKFDENVLGTADYLAPEQAQDSHTVDIRADIYSLGATFYYLLTGRTVFGEGTVAQKLMWHMSRVPKPVTEFRPEVPADLAAILQKMLAKEPAERFQTPGEVAAALEPFTQTPIEPPADKEMPLLSPAATGQTIPQAPSLETAETAVVKRDDSPGAVPKALQGMSSFKSPAKTNPAPPSPPPSAPSSPPSSAASSSALSGASAPPAGSGRTSGKTGAAPGPKSPGAKPRSSPRAPGASAPQPKSPKPSPKPSRPTPASPSPSASSSTAPNRTEPEAPARVQTLTPPEVETEENAFWEGLGSVDTADPSAKADTAPQPAPSSRRLLVKDAVKNKRRAWLIFGSLAIVAGILLIGALIYVVVTRPSTSTTSRPPLEISREGKPYRSLFQALKAARSGDVIQLTDEVHQENLTIEPKMNFATDVTIQAAPGVEVVWKSASKDEKIALLTLQHAGKFKVKGPGLTFDGTLSGGKKVRDLIVVNFTAPGLTIDGVTLKNFARSGINVMNAWGSKEQPIRFLNLSASAAPPPLEPAPQIDPKTKKIDPKAQPADPVFAALAFDVHPDITHPPYNDFMEVGAVHIEGGLKTAIHTKDNTVVGKNMVWPQ